MQAIHIRCGCHLLSGKCRFKCIMKGGHVGEEIMHHLSKQARLKPLCDVASHSHSVPSFGINIFPTFKGLLNSSFSILCTCFVSLTDITQYEVCFLWEHIVPAIYPRAKLNSPRDP